MAMRKIVVKRGTIAPKQTGIPVKQTYPAEQKRGFRYSRVDTYLDEEYGKIRPLPQPWTEDCVWIRNGKLEKKIKRANLYKYEGWEVIEGRKF